MPLFRDVRVAGGTVPLRRPKALLAGHASTVICLLVCAWCVPAQVVPAPAAPATPAIHDPLNRDTPQSSAFSFLEACRARDYARAQRYLDLRKLDDGLRASDGPKLAQQLGQVLDRDPRFDVASLSTMADGGIGDGLARNQEVVDTFDVDGKPEQLLLKHTALRSGLQVWLFAPESVSLIPKLAVVSSSSPIEKYLPPLLVGWTLMDTPLYRWIAMALLIVLLAALSRWISRLALWLADLLVKRTRLRIDSQVLHSFTGPFQLIFPVAMFRGAIPMLGLSALVRLVAERLCEFFLIVGSAWLCMRIADALASGLEIVLLARNNSFPRSTLSLSARLLKIAILVFAFTALLSDWGYNTSTILAGLGVGGIAIALAAQKTIENLFGGVSVISDRPVRIGDFCKFGTGAGTVEDIGLRSTRIRTVDRTLVTVPNGVFSAMTLENFSRVDKTLFHIKLNLLRDTTPEQVRALLESIGGTLKAHPRIESGAMPIRFVGIGSYSLDLEVFVYVRTTDGDEFLTIQQDLLLTILDEVAAAGTALALPTQASIDYSAPRHPVPEAREPVHDGGR
jgi:MscS family membrane protein